MGACIRWWSAFESKGEVRMIKKIIFLLKENKAVHSYKVVEIKKRSVELFYVTDKLETNRATDTVNYEITVYHDFEEYKGYSTFCVSPSFADEDIRIKIQEACARCLFVKNNYYPLPEPSLEAPAVIPSLDCSEPFDKIACRCADAVFKANVYQEGWINSCEFFVTETKTRVINSNGIDLSSTHANIFIELIPTWKGPHEEVELYQNISTSSVDYDAITAKVEETMQFAKARANAKRLPADLKKCTVILPSEEISMMMEFYAEQLNYANVFMKMNLFNVGDTLTDGTSGDKIDITMKPYVEGASKASSFDTDGIVLKPCHIIEDGVCKSLHGSNRFGYYLGEKNPTGLYTNMEVKGGTMSFEEMKKEPYLYCVYFSSPQLDGYSGYYGGEVRLGFYFDGKKVYPVSGFSISGNLHEDKNHFRFSKELETNQGYRGPKYLYIPNVTIC